MSNPFDLADHPAFSAWRNRKLAVYPVQPSDLRVDLSQLDSPTSAELVRLFERIQRFNFAVVRTTPEQITPDAILAFGRHLGLVRTDANLFADLRAVSTISPGGGDERADYTPYTSRALSWHTDGYYNAPEHQVRAWTLFCLRSAAEGGVNTLLDHEVAYMLLRDISPDHIRALSHPEALRIPANVRNGEVLRPESVGPVFSVRDGALHMRYSARTRHVAWRNTPETTAARDALDRLFSSSGTYTLAYRLAPGEGLVSNNVLHGRSAFALAPSGTDQRLLYRVRYFERIQPPVPPVKPE